MNKTETIRRITNEDGHCLDVGPTESADFVSIKPGNGCFKEWGFHEISMDVQFARLLGEALIKCCDEIDPTKGFGRQWWHAED